MLVTPSDLTKVLIELSAKPQLAIDTETTGLRHFHGDQLFSIIIADETAEYYFDFNTTLPRELIPKLHKILNIPTILWFGHNFKFDLHFINNEGIAVAGPTHCTMATMRLIHSELLSYSLDSCVKHALDKAKDDKVMAYIREHKLWTLEDCPGKAKNKRLHFDRVPLEIIQPYAELDARLTFDLGIWQLKKLGNMEATGSIHWPKIGKLYRNERSLTKTLLDMERHGVLINREYCKEALVHFHDTLQSCEKEFRGLTGKDFVDSGKLFSEIFPKDQLVMNDPTPGGKVNPSFDSEVLVGWGDPISKTILLHREAKKDKEFFEGLLYAADNDGVVRTSFRQSGTATGRMSSTDPNCQQWPKEEAESFEAVAVRRAIIPRPEFIFVMFDYEAMEMKLLYDLASAHSMIAKVREGLDVHQAMADRAKISRKQAKAGNFANIYGSGLVKFAQTLGCNEAQAKNIREAIFAAAPEIRPFIQRQTKEAEERGFSVNWVGRRCIFLDRRFCYKATNYVIQGGGADVIKIAMNKIHRHLIGKKSKMLLSIHDELLCEIHESETALIPEIKHIMEISYPHKHLPLTVSVEHSRVSFADRIKGPPPIV